MTEPEQQEITLTCREVQLIIKITPLEKSGADMQAEELAAGKHYVECDECCGKGLSVITGHNFSCQKALEILMISPQPASHYCQTFLEALAAEHVFGRPIRSVSPLTLDPHGGACKEKICKKFRLNWPRFYGYQLTIHDVIANGLPFAIGLFKEFDLPIRNLLAIQQRRLTAILETLLKGEKINISPRLAGYDNQWFVKEIIKNLKFLQGLVEPELAEK